jgi:enediyne biosynthesis protein E4
MHSLFSKICLVIAALSISTSCNKKAEQTVTGKTVFSKVSSDQSGIKFNNQVHNTPDFNIFSYRNFYNGGGVVSPMCL